MNTEKEGWMPVPSLDRYYVSDHGRFCGPRGIITGEISFGYHRVMLKGQHFQAHRIVARVFVQNPDSKSQVNHKDANKLNNHYTNLEWVTPRENIAHSWKLGLQRPKVGVDKWNVKLDHKKVKLIRRYAYTSENVHMLSLKLGVSYSCIHGVLTGRTWKHVKKAA